MSSSAIRNWFRTQVIARVPSVPFIETVNVVPPNKNLPNLWSTLEFSSSTETRVSIGSRACFRETGEVVIIVLGLSGRGDTAVISAAELFRSAFFNVRESLALGGGEFGSLVLDAAEPPNTDSTENGNWFLASISCAYTFDTVRGS